VYPAQSPPEAQEGELDLEPAAGDEGGREEVVCVISIGGFWIPFVCVCAHLDVTTSFRLSIFFFFLQLVHHRVLNCEPSESLVPILSPRSESPCSSPAGSPPLAELIFLTGSMPNMALKIRRAAFRWPAEFIIAGGWG
jgi:hypothetical protein